MLARFMANCTLVQFNDLLFGLDGFKKLHVTLEEHLTEVLFCDDGEAPVGIWATLNVEKTGNPAMTHFTMWMHEIDAKYATKAWQTLCDALVQREYVKPSQVTNG